MKMSNEMILVFVSMGGGKDSWNLKTNSFSNWYTCTVHMYIHVMYLGPWAVKCTSICPKVQFSYQLPQRQAYILYRLDFPIVFFLNHHLALDDPSFLPQNAHSGQRCLGCSPNSHHLAQIPTTLLTCFPRCAPRASPQSDQPST